MTQPFVLTDALLIEHRAGATLCLSPTARGASFSMSKELPATEALRVRGLVNGRPVFASRKALAAPPRLPPDGPDDSLDDDENPPSSESSSPMVALIRVRGVLSSEATSWACGMSDGYGGANGIIARARAAYEHPGVAAVVFDISSPGGDAAGCGEAAAELARMRADSSKPTTVFASQACSAAYWLATAIAGEGGLFVSESSDIGNVGCWMAHADFSARNEKKGVAITYVADPPGKVAGNPDAPLDKDARARMERNVAETTARFCSAVASYRSSLSTKDLMALDGDTRRGADAVAQGLADGVAASLDDVVALAYSRAIAARPPTITTGASTPNHQGIPMAYSQDIIKAAGITAGASDAAIEAAILPRLAFAAAALAALGETDTQRAQGVLTAKLEEAAAAVELRAQLSASTAVSDSVKREKLVEDAVVAGKLRSGQAWRWDVAKDSDGSVAKGADGKDVRVRSIAPFLADQSTAQLEGYLEGLPAIHRDASRTQAADTSAADAAAASRGVGVPMTAAVARVAAKHGIDLNRLANATANLTGSGAAANEES